MTEEPNLLQPQNCKDSMLEKAFKALAPKVIFIEKQESDDDHYDGSHDSMKLEPLTIIWQNVFFFIAIHVAFIFGSYLCLFHAKWQTILFGVFLMELTALGVTAGAHRLWTHKSFKAKLPLRIFLSMCNAMAMQNDIYDWVRDHRVHHKFVETNADPHNIKRGFFFAHIGWLMVKKQKDVIEKGKTVDLSDLWADPVIRIQYRFYVPLSILCGLVIPTFIPYYYWDEDWSVSFFFAVFFRLVIILHATWSVNSATHFWGMKPYDKSTSAADINFVSILTGGEGFHNYHHVFPWDYATSELGYKYNITTFFIDCMAYIGQAYDLKKATPENILQRKLRTGDGSYFKENEKKE